MAFLSGHYESVIAISVSEGLSGTYGAFLKVAQSLTGRKISVIDSKSISAGLGLLVDRASELALAGYAHDESPPARVLGPQVPPLRRRSDPQVLHPRRAGQRREGAGRPDLHIKPSSRSGADGKTFNAAKTFSRKGMLAKSGARAGGDREGHGLGLCHRPRPESRAGQGL